jgi:hypothetical protein
MEPVQWDFKGPLLWPKPSSLAPASKDIKHSFTSAVATRAQKLIVLFSWTAADEVYKATQVHVPSPNCTLNMSPIRNARVIFNEIPEGVFFL